MVVWGEIHFMMWESILRIHSSAIAECELKRDYWVVAGLPQSIFSHDSCMES